MNIQFKKGVLDLLVLALLAKEDRYGYDISETISGTIRIAAGTVYPILRKLKEEGLVTTYLSEESNGPARKYYSLTQSGRKKMLETKNEWLGFVDSIAEILEVHTHE
jgi:PadR family transcriptional regulator PadR